jgi:hypothetical protein
MYHHRPQTAFSQSPVAVFPKRVNRFTTWLFSTKQLDLLILAGCSCLFTLVYQPIAHAITASAINANVVMTYPVQFSNLYSKSTEKGTRK